MTWLAVTLAAIALGLGVVLARQERLARRRQHEMRRQMLFIRRSLMNVRRSLAAQDARRQLRERGEAERLPLRFAAAAGEDVYLWELFKDAPPGVFIEAGAYDGVTSSVSYVFEALGWRGLLVEAQPEAAAKCRAARPGAKVVHAALVKPGSPPTVTFTQVEGDDSERKKSHAQTNAQHLKEMRRRVNAASSITVPAVTLDEALGTDFERVDFAVIDVEGGEPDVLRGFSLDRYRPRVLLIEDKSQGADPELAELVRRCGYTRRGFVSQSAVFIREDCPDLLERARWVATLE